MAEARRRQPLNPDFPTDAGKDTSEDARTWRVFFQSVPHPTMVIDRTYTVISANEAVSRSLNQIPGEVVGRKCYELFHEGTRPTPGCPMERLLSEGRSGVVEIEVQALHSTSLISCIPVCDEMGEIIRAVHIATDITELKNAQEALQESQERYRSHFENISDVIFSLDRALNIVNVSPSAEKIAGYKPEELVGKCFTDLSLLVPESLDLAMANIARTLQGENNVTAEYTFIDKNGVEKIGEASASPLFSADGAVIGINAVVRDITERKATEAALQESESKFRNLSEKSVAGIYLIQDGAFRYVNSTLAEIFGFAIDEMIGKMGPEDVVIPSDWPLVRENLRKRLEGETESLRYELRIRTKDGGVKTVEIYSSRTTYKGKPAVIGTLLDITERKQTEGALLQSEEKYRSIFEHAAEGIFQTTPEGQFLNANPALARMTGYEKSEDLISCITNVGLQLYVDPEDRRRALRIMNEEGVIRTFETRFFRKDGTKIWVSLAGRPVRDQNDRILYYEGTATDITERKRSEEELRGAHQRLFDIIEFLPDATFVIDQDKKVVAWNRAIEEMTGVTKEEIIGKADYCYAMALYGEKGRCS